MTSTIQNGEGVERDMSSETVLGFRVAAYRETHPEHGDTYGHTYSEHWSTPNTRDPRVKVERLFTEEQLRHSLAREPATADVERVLLRAAGITKPVSVVNRETHDNGTEQWSEVRRSDRTPNDQVAHCADQEDADLIAHLINAALSRAAQSSNDAGVHKAHCYQGENEGGCKYGDDDCPAAPSREPAIAEGERSRWTHVRTPPSAGGCYAIGGYVETGGLPRHFQRAFAYVILTLDGPSWSHCDDRKAHIPIEYWQSLGAHPEHAQSSTPPASKGVEIREALLEYAVHYGSRCRDCADEGGICSSTGIGCGDRRMACAFVIDALIYGASHGFCPSSLVREAKR